MAPPLTISEGEVDLGVDLLDSLAAAVAAGAAARYVERLRSSVDTSGPPGKRSGGPCEPWTAR